MSSVEKQSAVDPPQPTPQPEVTTPAVKQSTTDRVVDSK